VAKASEAPTKIAPSIRITGAWWRIGRARSDPLTWTEEPSDGRWQRGEIVRALYLADSPETAWAEWFRHSAELGVPPQTRLPRDLWRFEVDLDGVADLTTDGVLAAHGVTGRMSPSRRQWPETQPVGEAYWRSGSRAVVAPSAAHQGGRVLAVFRTRKGAIAGLKPIRPARRFTELPALPTGLRT
jgi:RES domain-containing protein